MSKTAQKHFLLLNLDSYPENNKVVREKAYNTILCKIKISILVICFAFHGSDSVDEKS